MKTLKTTLRLCAIAMLAISLFACGNADDSDSADGSSDSSATTSEAGTSSAPSTPSTDLMGKMLDELEGLTAVLKDVKDEASAKSAAQYITEYAERHEKLAEQYNELTPAEQMASAQKSAQRNMDVQLALQQEMMRVGLDPVLSVHLSDAFQKINRQ